MRNFFAAQRQGERSDAAARQRKKISKDESPHSLASLAPPGRALVSTVREGRFDAAGGAERSEAMSAAAKQSERICHDAASFCEGVANAAGGAERSEAMSAS